MRIKKITQKSEKCKKVNFIAPLLNRPKMPILLKLDLFRSLVLLSRPCNDITKQESVIFLVLCFSM